ncbi:winged helix-turn-helix domain-containing protein [Aquiluna sp. Uisw_065]|jgi:DNA-binding winged helix-turn-helix (wHTH) protein|uniref:winged helix-turn-helix domain-containing protein n=1 Tax=Aquiluna sp. Uisw_065 TaxID=3230967 RepID=UPI0039E7C9E4
MPAIQTKSINVAKGFALYVGISEQDAQEAGLTLAQIAQALKQTLATLVPTKATETYAAVALAPEGSTGRNLDITRLALREPRATSTPANTEADEKTAAKGLVVDLTRKRLFVDGANAQLTCKEFELFAFLIENTGETVSRKQIADISDRCGESTPNARTIDVHVRRLRAKIAGYEDVIRTSRGVGYRFDKHPDVLVQQF